MQNEEKLGFKTVVGDPTTDPAPIHLCDEHSSQVNNALVDQGFDRRTLMPTVLHLPNKGPPPPAIVAFQMLTNLAIRTLGTEAVVNNQGCPICALEKFNWAVEVSKVVSLQLIGPKKVQ